MISVSRDLLSLNQAAKLAGMSRRTFANVAAANGLNPIVIGGMKRILYRKADVARLMAHFGTSDTAVMEVRG